MAAVTIPENPPVGYRFHPTDEELVDHYLKLKVQGFTGVDCIIPDVEICKWEPSQLPGIFEEQSIVPPDDKVQEWWFFCPQTPPIRRSTTLGFWKKTGDDRTIKAGDSNRAIGTKKVLVFHVRCGQRKIKTNWVIHEYHLPTNNLNELFPHAPTKNYVVCHLKHKGNEESDFSALQLNGGGIMDLDSGLHQPERNNSFPESWSEAVGNSLISSADRDSNLHQPEHENSCPQPWVLVGSATETSLQQDNQVQVITPNLRQTFFQSENVNSQTDLHVGDFGSLVDNDVFLYIDESDQVQVDFIDRDQIQTQLGLECSPDDEHAVLMKSQQAQMSESLHVVVSLDEKKGFIEHKFNGLHISSPKHMEPPKKPEIARTYSTDEESRVEKVEKLELAARNIKPECVTLDELEAKAKVGESREITDCTKISMVPPLHDQASRLHKGSILEENWLTSTNKSLDGVLKGKKGSTESELDGWEIVSAKQTEHPKKAGNAGISCKYKDPRLEKLKMPEFSLREKSNQMVHLWSNRRPDQSHRGESNEHGEETEPASEISNSASPLAGSTSNHAEISANSSIFKLAKRFIPW